MYPVGPVKGVDLGCLLVGQVARRLVRVKLKLEFQDAIVQCA
jgi:hypothetical protein